MNFFRKLTFLTLITTLILGVLGGSALAAEDTSLKQSTDELTDKELQLAEFAEEYLQYNSKTNQFIIEDEKGLSNALENENINTEEFMSQVKTLNENIEVNEASNGDASTMSACSTALSVIGLAHGMSLEAAGIALGVAPWLVFGIVGSIGVVYVGGAIMCP